MIFIHKYVIHFLKPLKYEKILVRFSSHRHLFKNALQFRNNLALVDHSDKYTYSRLLNYSIHLSKRINEFITQHEKEQKQISMLCPNDVTYVIAKWAIWLTGNVAVPLYKDHPSSFLEYYIKDSKSSLIITTSSLKDKVEDIAKTFSLPLLLLDYPDKMPLEDIDKMTENRLSQMDLGRHKTNRALIIYTSGTTGPPKGVVLTHYNLHYQINALLEAWEWSCHDIVLNSLPLHHMHGIMNALLCPLTIGACCMMLPKFEAQKVWDHLLDTRSQPRVNLFMGVPTMYAKLIEAFENIYETKKYTKLFIKAVCQEQIRLMVCGSASLPDPIMKKWEEITGHTLLERYGMTEVGMALSNPLHGKRIPGTVGQPLPNVEVRIVKKEVYAPSGYTLLVLSSPTNLILPNPKGELLGELQIRGPNVFLEYFNRKEATKEAFTPDGWFKTGDVAQYMPESNSFKILGRSSTDIIKSGGYKISALDIERILLSHPKIKECTVVGLPDITWNEKVAAVVVPKEKGSIDAISLKKWCKEQMPPYYIPSEFLFVEEIPRNALGKVNKKDIVKVFFPESTK